MRLLLLPLTLLFPLAASTPGGHHAVLGVLPGAADDEIRAAYRKLALKLHPDKNPDSNTEEWLRVQQAYEALSGRGGSSGRRSSPFSYHYEQQQQQQSQQQRRTAWQRFWQEPRPPPRIESEAEELDASAFYHRVLGAGSNNGARAGGPWLIQIYSHASPYCRVLSTHWEEAVRGPLSSLANFGRIDADAHPMLVRFVASHVRLFAGQQPSKRELPAVVGIPAGCGGMSCAVAYSGRLTAEGLQHFAAAHLLRLPPLRPLSPWLLGAWRWAVPAGNVALLALLPEGQPQPLGLLAAVARAQGRLQAAAAVWRPANRALWVDKVGAASAPALILWRDESAQPAAVIHGSLLTNSIEWAKEVDRHIGVHQRTPPPSARIAARASAVFVSALHLASQADLLWRQAAGVALSVAQLVDWRLLGLTTLLAGGLLGLRQVLDCLSGTEEDAYCGGYNSEDGSPQKSSSPQRHPDSSSSGGRVLCMAHSDWEPSPGRYLVLLPLAASAGTSSSSQAQVLFASLAAVFQRERRLSFRVAPVSGAAARLAAAAGAAGAREGLPAFVLHPRRGRFQVVQLASMQQAVVALEEVLSGGGLWHQWA